MMDVKTLSGAAGLYREGPHARSNRRGAPVAERARKVHVDYVGRARALDHAHSRQADGTPYPGVREQVQRHLVGPVLAALRAWDPVVGLVVGSYQGCSEGLHALAREVAEERARTEWRRMGARSEHEALGIFVHDVHRRWGSVFWRSWARVIRGRLPAIGRPNAEILHHGPPPAYARGQAAVGGAEPWPQRPRTRHPRVARRRGWLWSGRASRPEMRGWRLHGEGASWMPRPPARHRRACCEPRPAGDGHCALERRQRRGRTAWLENGDGEAKKERSALGRHHLASILFFLFSFFLFLWPRWESARIRPFPIRMAG